MRNRLPLPELREQAIALRRAGKSRREIKAILRITSNETLNDALRGEPPQMSTWRPNAKDDLRASARELRTQGLAYSEIAAELGVSKSSVSLWVRDLPRPERLSYSECARRQAAGVAAYWAAERPRRQAAREATRDAASECVGELSPREILLAGAVAYWCEGSKSKPYRQARRVIFINSDPALVRFFLHFLDVADVPRGQLAFRVSIHERADVAAAQDFWIQLTGASPSQFRRPNLKRHNPSTTRLNTGAGYRGCLRIDVLRGSRLYDQIEGWCDAVLASAGTGAPSGSADR